MKKKIFLFISLAMFGLGAALLVFSCSKNDEPSPPLSDQKVDSRGDEDEIPYEVAQYLSEAEIAAFWASKPSNDPPSPPKEKGDKRPKKWRPFFAWGETIGTNLPVLNCGNYGNADICWAHEDCPSVPLGPPLTPPLVSYVSGEGHMSGYGQVAQEWKRFVCPPAAPRVNGTYIKDEHRLHWRPLPGVSCASQDGLYITTLSMKVCNSSLPLDEQCWTTSTGDFEDSQGTFNYRIITTWNFCAPPTTTYPFFTLFNPAYRIAWGWLWY